MIDQHLLVLTMDITAWCFLIASWVVPRFMSNNENKATFGLITSAIALGIFIGTCIVRWFI